MKRTSLWELQICHFLPPRLRVLGLFRLEVLELGLGRLRRALGRFQQPEKTDWKRCGFFMGKGALKIIEPSKNGDFNICQPSNIRISHDWTIQNGGLRDGEHAWKFNGGYPWKIRGWIRPSMNGGGFSSHLWLQEADPKLVNFDHFGHLWSHANLW